MRAAGGSLARIASATRRSGQTNFDYFQLVFPRTFSMMKLSAHAACALILAVTSVTAAHARDLDKSDPDRAQILAAVHRLNDSNSNLKDYRYVVVDLVKDRDAAFLCVALADHDGGLILTDDQAGIMTFALEKRDPRWVAINLGGVGFAAGARPVQSDCVVNGRTVNTRADINAALKANGRQPFASR
ncbi:hypothetical protein [Burkholderia sp. LMG 13014]|uniref:hypothetical protein n=1 Tax=Burkholderia sp. LMG 13014 TaxID=2709306 RepID=UPI0019628363|nr:hypothetical protein [Burkholderia sp. LMG 13014]